VYSRICTGLVIGLVLLSLHVNKLNYCCCFCVVVVAAAAAAAVHYCIHFLFVKVYTWSIEVTED
jgi:hypothetical protein